MQAWWVIEIFTEVVWRPPSFCCPAICLYSVQQCSEKAHACRWTAVCVTLSDFQHKEQHMKGGGDHMHCMHFFDSDTCHLFSVNGWSHFNRCVCVCVRETGLLPRPYHANPFCRISIRQASVRNCRLLGMFLILLTWHIWGVDHFQYHSLLSGMTPPVIVNSSFLCSP